MSDLERYRAFAQLCRDMAMSESDTRERDPLLRVSAAWERAAQRIEHVPSHPTGAADKV